MESNDSPEIPDKGVTSDIPGLPSGAEKKATICLLVIPHTSPNHKHSKMHKISPDTNLCKTKCTYTTSNTKAFAHSVLPTMKKKKALKIRA